MSADKSPAAREALLKRAAEILSAKFGASFPEEFPEVAQWFIEYDDKNASMLASDIPTKAEGSGRLQRKVRNEYKR